MGGQHDIELLWFSDCPNHQAARVLLREVVAELSPESAIRDIDATDPDVAEKLRFPGSPTIRVDGRDVQPGFEDPGDYAPRCRLYWTEQGLARASRHVRGSRPPCADRPSQTRLGSQTTGWPLSITTADPEQRESR